MERIRRRRHLLQRILPPPKNQTPTHWDKFVPSIGGSHDLNRIALCDVVVGLEIAQVVDLAPRVVLNKTSAHLAIDMGTAAGPPTKPSAAGIGESRSA